MYNWRKWIWPGILSVLLMTALATWMRSDFIEQDLAAKAEKALDGQHLWATIELDGRDLVLGGTAPSQEAISTAVKLAQGTYDVRTVDNQAELIPQQADYSFTADHLDGKLSLSGYMPSEGVKKTILDAARQAFPKAEIEEKFELARGAPKEYAKLTGYGLAQLANLKSGKFELNGSTLSLKGVAGSTGLFKSTMAAFNAPLPVNGELGSVDISPPTEIGRAHV